MTIRENVNKRITSFKARLAIFALEINFNVVNFKHPKNFTDVADIISRIPIPLIDFISAQIPGRSSCFSRFPRRPSGIRDTFHL